MLGFLLFFHPHVSFFTMHVSAAGENLIKVNSFNYNY